MRHTSRIGPNYLINYPVKERTEKIHIIMKDGLFFTLLQPYKMLIDSMNQFMNHIKEQLHYADKADQRNM